MTEERGRIVLTHSKMMDKNKIIKLYYHCVW